MRAGIQVNYKNFNYDKSSEIWVLLIIPTIHKPKEICAVEQSTEESPDTVSSTTFCELRFHFFVFKKWCWTILVANGYGEMGDYFLRPVPQRPNRSYISREKKTVYDSRWKVSAVLFLAERTSGDWGIRVNPRLCKLVGLSTTFCE